MGPSVTLVGLDFGTTTSSAVIADARLTHNAVSARTELSQVVERYRSEIVFTPFQDDRLDLERLEASLDRWLSEGGLRAEQLFGGGALLTGLAARAENAAELVRLVRRRLSRALVATADDSCLESWLAFMGSCAELSRAQPDQFILNLDIGGGTTNLALGKGGEVLRTGCLFVGARHIQLEPGTYRIVKLSHHAERLLTHLGVRKGRGQSLNEADVAAVLDWYHDLLAAAVAGAREVFQGPAARLHEQVAFRLPKEAAPVVVTLSGGVGELVYAHLQGQPLPPTTHFGDLGIDLARRLLQSPWAEHFRTHQPAGGGRATVYGLLRHSTQVSGNTLFLPRPETLPLADIPILGEVASTSSKDHIHELVELARRSAKGACLLVALHGQDAGAVRDLGQRLASALKEPAFPAGQPLVLLVRQNLGKVLGNYVTEWGARPLNLVVIDEIAVRAAEYVQIGPLQEGVVPVSFYGLRA